MYRCAVFIDAGYVTAAGGKLCLNTGRRALIGCDYRGLVDLISQFAQSDSGLPLLRTYWYDAAFGATPTFEQTMIAHLPDVKLRLGHLQNIGGRTIQKGVDTYVVSDMMVLAQERSISAAYLVTGDEDIRLAVIAAQRLGVRVVLVGVAGRTADEFTQATKLISEADKHVLLDQATLQPFYVNRKALPRSVSSAAILAGAGANPTTEDIGRSFGRIWSADLTTMELRSLMGMRMHIPLPIDGQLRSDCNDVLPPNAKRPDLRAGFWKGVDDVHNPPVAPPLPVTAPAGPP